MHQQQLSQLRKNRWRSCSRDRQMERRCTFSGAWSKSHHFMTTEGQELATTVTSLDTRRGSARTPLGAHGVHKKDTTIANQENLSVATVERGTQQPTGSAQSTESNKKEKSTYVVMISTLNILQANLYRSSGVQDALYNDLDIWDFDAILIQEPHYWEIAGNLQITGAGPNFEVIKLKTLQRENQI